MREFIQIETQRREVLVDITPQVESVEQRSGIQNGLVSVYVQGATAAIMIQENWDDSVQTDVVNLLAKMIPRGVWLHGETWELLILDFHSSTKRKKSIAPIELLILPEKPRGQVFDFERPQYQRPDPGRDYPADCRITNALPVPGIGFTLPPGL